VISLRFFGHLKLFETGCNIFSEILIISLIILSKVEPSNKSSLKIKQVIIMLVFHLFFQWIEILYIFSSTWLLGLRFLLKPSDNVLSSTFEGHVKTFLFLLLDYRKFLYGLNTNKEWSRCLYLTFIMEKFFITESTSLRLCDYSG